MMVEWECPKKGCDYRRRENGHLSYVAHRAKNGEEHPLRKVAPRESND